jgi:uncharacterized protein YbjT (DUF2867 family)
VLLVTGASGFIGSAVCAQAVRQGLDVLGLSRTGEPTTLTDELRRVRWHKLDVFDRKALEALLRGVTAIAHCVGIARERPNRKETWKRINGDAAIAVAEAGVAAGVPSFVFVSAAEKPPWAHEEYLSSKRRAELALGKLAMRLVVMRPGLVYGDTRPASKVAAAGLKMAQLFNVELPFVRGNAPLALEVFAKAVVRACVDDRVRGVLEGEQLARLVD